MTIRSLGLSACVFLSACGWHPVYERSDRGSARAALSHVTVGLIPERGGQLLRLALQERLERFGGGAGTRFDLNVSYSVRGEGIAVLPTNTVTRTRLVGVADWKLSIQDPQRTTLSSGFARNVDGLDVINQQYFAADLQSEAVQRRLVQTIADDIVEQLALYFERHPSPDG